MVQQSTPPPTQGSGHKPLPEPFMIQIAPAKPERENFQQVIVGAFGLTGALVLAAVVSGVALAGLWILVRKWRRTYDYDAPPSLGSVELPRRPPSSPDR